MVDNSKPGYLCKAEIELYEEWYKAYSFDLYREFMQAVAEFYIKVGKGDPVEDLDKAIQVLQLLKEKETEHAGTAEIRTLEKLLSDGYKYLARDSKESWSTGGISAYAGEPQKYNGYWVDLYGLADTELLDEEFTEVKWADDEPMKIADLLETYQAKS